MFNKLYFKSSIKIIFFYQLIRMVINIFNLFIIIFVGNNTSSNSIFR